MTFILFTESSPLAAASDIHRQVSANMAGICHDWLTDQNTDCCFVVIGLVQDIRQSLALQLKIDPTGPPSLIASSDGQRIFINSTVSRNIYTSIHRWSRLCRSSSYDQSRHLTNVLSHAHTTLSVTEFLHQTYSDCQHSVCSELPGCWAQCAGTAEWQLERISYHRSRRTKPAAHTAETHTHRLFNINTQPKHTMFTINIL